jgi:CDGSH-type Zn-finger protein
MSITACANGPLLVRGEIPLLDPSGQEIEQTRKTIALCRCGASTIKPFCDGTHKLIHFTTDQTGHRDD